MDAATTVVRIGSISKSFFATTVTQLVEQGKLSVKSERNRFKTACQYHGASIQDREGRFVIRPEEQARSIAPEWTCYVVLDTRTI
jgi:hypothetical protein